MNRSADIREQSERNRIKQPNQRHSQQPSQQSQPQPQSHNRLNHLIKRMQLLEQYYQQQPRQPQTNRQHNQHNHNPESKQSHSHRLPNLSHLSSELSGFVPPSPVFAFLHRYPLLASYGNQLLYWDTHLCIYINRYSANHLIAGFFKIISRLGDGWFWYAMLMVAGVVGGMAALPALLVTVVVSLLGVAIYKLLKLKTVRPRPYQVHQVIKLGERPLDVFSFPSGHTLQAVLFTCALGGFFPWLLWLMLPFTLLVAVSRMVLGLHYPTDVLIGAILGYGLSLLAPILLTAVI